ncbi:MAG: hypothetical protein Q4A63_04020 [Butyricicoccus pullicaecorum]|nr:hypothetical protein [Butyricicoccus pullicaecorum]
MENYIVINGKKAELTPEQLEKLGIVVKENPFERTPGERYYAIYNTGEIGIETDVSHSSDILRYNVANYCLNKDLMKQRALHETLSRLLWRYSMTHDGDKIDWNDETIIKYSIYYNYDAKQFYVHGNLYNQLGGTIYFYSYNIAESAIEEIIEPFMKGNPDFVW